MATIKLTVEQQLNLSNTLHINTTWQIASRPDFQPQSMLMEINNSTTYLLEYNYDIPSNYKGVIYARSKYHFSNDVSSNWSSVISIDQKTKGTKLSINNVLTPKVKYEIDYSLNLSGDILLTTSVFGVLGNTSGTHISTTWSITDSSGNIVYSRENDEEHLTSLVVNLGDLIPGKAYLISAIHNSIDNNSSNPGVTVLSVYSREDYGFEITTPYPLVLEQWLYFSLKLFTTDFKTIDIIIKDDENATVASNYGQTSKTPRVYTGPLKQGVYYTIQARIEYLDGGYSKYKTITTSTIKDNLLIEFNPTTVYSEEYNYIQPLNLSGKVIQSSHQIYTGSILLAKNNDTNIYRYVVSNNKLKEIEVAFELTGSNDPLNLPFFNFVPLYSGRILVNYALDLKDQKYRRSMFVLYDYNTITHKFTKVLERETDTAISDEFYSTGESASLGVVNYHEVYYISGMEVSDADNTVISQRLKKLNTDTFEITDVCNLPFVSKRYTNMIVIDYDTLLVLGGSNATVTQSSFDLPIRTNNNIYTYKISTNTWAVVNTLPASLSNKLYNFQAYMRKDKKIVLFMSIGYGSMLGEQRTIVIDPSNNYSVVREDNDHADGLEYQNSIVLRNGDIYRISSSVVDPQKVYNYVSDTTYSFVDAHTVDFKTNLIVPKHKLVTIENPYAYLTIMIEGNSLLDSGELHWLDGDVLRVFKYRDLLIPHDVNIPLLNTINWDTVTILTGLTMDTDTGNCNLVVSMNSIVEITNPYQYCSITIEGTSYEDSGELRWDDGQTVRVFKYKDLLVPRTIDLSIIENNEWDSVTILADLVLTTTGVPDIILPTQPVVPPVVPPEVPPVVQE
jgi:hypothetical protein